jgi:hypothetical protein
MASVAGHGTVGAGVIDRASLSVRDAVLAMELWSAT